MRKPELSYDPTTVAEYLRDRTAARADLNEFCSSDERMLAVLHDLFAQVDDLAESHSKLRASEVRIAANLRLLEEAKRLLDGLERMRNAAEEDSRIKTADLRRLRAEIDPDEINLKIMYAVDAALEQSSAEIGECRATIASYQSEIQELKRSKKRLREALERLSMNT